jgi:hypothetical protein
MGWTYRSLFLFEIVPDRGLWNTPGMGQAPQTLALEEWDVMMSWLSTFFFFQVGDLWMNGFPTDLK